MSADTTRICYLNGRFLPLAEARVSVLDRGFIFGDAVYEVIPVVGARPFACAEHLARLARSLAAIGIPDPMDARDWRRCLHELVAANGGGDLSIYLQVTRGVAERDHVAPHGLTPTVFAMCRPLALAEGVGVVSAVVLPDNRWGRCDVKTTALIANVLLRNEAVRRGAYEAILVRDGALTEGAASNVFVVRAGRISTPPNSPHVLPGVTRALLLDVARRAGFDAVEEEVPQDALRAADEIWLTSSTRDLVCVRELDGAMVADGRDYPVAAAVLAAFQAYRAERLSAAQADPSLE